MLFRPVYIFVAKQALVWVKLHINHIDWNTFRTYKRQCIYVLASK